MLITALAVYVTDAAAAEPSGSNGVEPSQTSKPAAAHVALYVRSPDGSASPEDMAALAQWLETGLGQSGYTVSSQASAAVVVEMGAARWVLTLGVDEPAVVLPADDFRLASFETLHRVAAALDAQRSVAEDQAGTTPTPAPTRVSERALAVVDPPALLPVENPENAGAAGTNPSVAAPERDDAFSGAYREAGSVPWSVLPRVHAGAQVVHGKSRFAFGVGTEVLRGPAWSLAGDLQYAAGQALPSLAVRDFTARLAPAWLLHQGAFVRLELAAWIGVALHQAVYNGATVSTRWQSLLGLPFTAWFRLGPVELGLRPYVQLNPAWQGLSELHTEPYQAGFDVLGSVAKW